MVLTVYGRDERPDALRVIRRVKDAVAFFGDWFDSLQRDDRPPFAVTVCLTGATKQASPTCGTECLTGARINSGVTFSDARTGVTQHVLVFRAEECVKVLIHELIHAYGLDYRTQRAEPSQLLLFETFTETMATVLHAMYEAVANASGYPASLDAARRLLRTERAHAACVADRIARMAGYEDYVICAKANGVDAVTFRQDTHAYEYYVLRAVLLNADARLLREFAGDPPWPRCASSSFRALLRRAIASAKNRKRRCAGSSTSLAMTIS